MSERTALLLAIAAFVAVGLLILIFCRDKRFKGNLLVAIFAVELGILFGYLTFSFQEEAGGAGPASVPRLWISALMVVGAFLVYRILTGREEPDPEPGNIKLVLAVMSVIITYMLLIPRAGYFVATFPYIIVSCILISYRKHYMILLISGGWLVFVYFVFVKALHVPLPPGSFFR